MKQISSPIFSFLRGLTYLSFFSSILFFIFMLIIEFTNYELQWGTFSVVPQNKNGYSIPVDVTINNLPDTSIKVTHISKESHISTGYETRFFGTKKSKGEKFDSLMKLDSAKIKMYLYKWIAEPMTDDVVNGWGGGNSYESFANGIKRRSIDVSFESIHNTVYVKAKGKNGWQNFLLAFESYFNMLIWIFIFYQLIKIFSSLKNKLSFVTNLYKRIRIIGLVLIFNQLVLFLYSFVYLQIFGIIMLDKALPEGEEYNGITMQFNPTNSANFSYIILGLSLLILSLLFKYGNKLEKDAELTI